jgi:predicted DNA binding protein
MSVIVEFTVPAEALAMHQTLSESPEMTIEIERVVAHRSDTLTPYFWIRGGDRDRFESAIAEDPSVEEATRLDDYNNATLYRASWPRDIASIGQAYLQTGATILEAVGRHEEWELRLRFDDYEGISYFQEYCIENDIPFEVNRIYNPTTPRAGGQFGVTPKQREGLVAALEAGYYDGSQDTTMSDVAEELGITQQALSKRLRRAHGNLVSNVLTVEELGSDE